MSDTKFIKDVKYCPWCGKTNIKQEKKSIASGLTQFACLDCKILFFV